MTQSVVAYSDYALECFRLLSLHPWTIAEIMRINADELHPVTNPNPIEGFLRGYPSVMWRRAVRRAHISSYLEFEGSSEDNPDDAWNYVSVYRWATKDEQIRHERRNRTLLVVAVMSNLDLARYVV